MKYVSIFFEVLRSLLINVGSEIGAWLAPLPSAVSVANAAHRHLGYEPWLCVVVGAIVELLGFATTNRASDLWYYNQTRRDDEPPAPLKLAGLLVFVYVVSTIALSVISDLRTDVVAYLPAIFPILALTGTVSVALGRQHTLRLQHNKQAAAERQLAAEKAETERKQREIEAKSEQARREMEAKAEAERLRQEQLRREAEERDRAERLRLERKADRLARQTPRPNATPGATLPAVNRDTFIKFYTTPDYAVVEDLAHSLGFNGQLKAFYTDGRRSVSRLAQLVGVNPRTAQRWVDASNVATDVAASDATFKGGNDE